MGWKVMASPEDGDSIGGGVWGISTWDADRKVVLSSVLGV